MRVYKATAIFAFWTLVTASVLLASVVLLAKFSLPLLNVYQPQIERNLTQLTGMRVQVGQLLGELNGIDVELSVSDIKVSTAEQEGAIQVEDLNLELDIAKTLLTFSPQFKNVSVANVTVLLQEDGAGKVSLRGLAESTKASGGANVAMSRVLNYAAEQQQMSFTDLRVDLRSPRFADLNIHVPATYLVKQSSRTLLRSDVFINDIAQPIQVRAQISTDLTNFLQQQVQAYIDVPEINLPLDWLQTEAVAKLQDVSLAGEYWLTYQPNNGVSLQADNSRFKLSFTEQAPLFVSADWRLRLSSDGMNATVTNMAFNDDGRLYEGVDIKAEWERQGNRTFVVFNKMDAAIANRLALNFVPEDWRLAKILSGLRPRGEAQNASLRIWRGSEKLRYQYLSNLINAEVEGHNGIPAVNNVYGLFSLTDSQGSIEFKSQQAQLAFPTVYDDVWEVAQASGEVAWQLHDNAFVVSGRELSIERNGATIRGGFHLEQPRDETGVGEDWLTVDINAQNVPKQDRLTFVPPNVLSEELTQWLDKALGDGEARNVDLLLRTGLKKGVSEPHLRLAIDANLDRVSFADNWPSATQVNGRVLVDNRQISVDVKSALFAGLPVENIQVIVPIRGERSGWLTVQGDVEHDAGKVLSTLAQTPLKSSVLAPFVDWQIGGEVTGEFAVVVPIQGQAREPDVTLALAFTNNPLNIAQIALPLRVGQGVLHYNSEQGLHDTRFSVTTLGGASDLVLTSERLASGRLAIDGVIKGTVDTVQLAKWRQAPAPVISRVQGVTAYSASLGVGRSQADQVDFNLASDLKGVSLALPAPFAKRSDQLRPTDVRIQVLAGEVMLETAVQNLVHSRLLIQEGGLKGGSVSLFKPLPKDVAITKGVSFYGQFDEFNWQTWQPIVEDFSPKMPLSEPVAAPAPIAMVLPEWIRAADIIVDHVPINDNNQLNNVKLTYSRGQAGHPLSVTSDELNAVLRQTDAGPELHVHYLNWRSADKLIAMEGVEPVAAEASQDSALQPGVIPSMLLRVDQILIDNRPYGDWQGKVVNLGNSIRIDDISTRLPKGQFKGQIFWQGGAQENVELTIKAEGENARELTKKFSPTPFLSSNRYQMDIALSWKDSLLKFDRPSLNGRIQFNVQNGNFNQVDQLPPFLRLLGIFNVDALAKRLTFDFTDLYEPGMPFDSFSSSLFITDGILNTAEPVRVKSPTAEITLQGSANLVDETLKERLTATVPITSSLPVAGLLLASPQIAGLLYITDKLIGDQLSKVTSIQYEIEGPFSNPKVTPVPYSPIR
ncbi:hypothetical protein MAQ5080_00810 [Marinomonas aquimarina]|uniref:YhdP central domain-containing protein n=1 Tax=Marinomonas aquimarina TaxID=295068 RepID=A0A1A8T6P1_9GAMM|nr:YhdP family protein [Marinomonas aquimarina]SBS27389.1 hypothetical protein MAQ5080_00810 [Marinomonas aquimarina]